MNKKTYDYIILILIVLLALVGIWRYTKLNRNSEVPSARVKNAARQERPASRYISLAKEEYFKGNYRQAIKLWEQSLDAKPYHPDLVYHDLGLCYMNLKEYDKGIEALDKAIELNPDYIDFYYLKAVIYEQSGNTALYRKNLEKVISMKDLPNSKKTVVSDTYQKLAELENNAGNYKKADEYVRLSNEYH